MTSITLTRDLHLPDDLRVARALSAPHLGPHLLFFSGGSALNGISRQLKRYTYNSIHLITPFDSGGSSQILREAFDMPAVGDLRSRLMALADESVLGQPDVYALFTHRLARDGLQDDLAAEVAEMRVGQHPLIRAVARPMRSLIQSLLQSFATKAPAAFDYRNASIGNLILAGGYLSNDRALEPVLFLMSKMVDVRGTVRAVIDANLQLGVDLEDGTRIIGQRLLSGKELAPITSPVARLFLSDGQDEIPAAQFPLPARNERFIARSDLICFPPGSLFSSVVANLLPSGVGRAIAARKVPKVYLPSLGEDPEALGLSLSDQVGALLAPLERDAGDGAELLTHVICDVSRSEAECEAASATHGIPCIRLSLTGDKLDRYDAQKVCDLLVSLA
ncbi:CofD-related protein, GAK system [Poseidonocella pacifica]|uniref:CofD-related protein, GAK system n=1 Tax=Poseidonocella pacifica TaxID=871651 RepID=A0A1I0XBN8_9RHOB|nr:GAK system CofD-like protein [Poseidonocella pacifica]SFA98445.1 CofD-related protein, GAK system [Poseidonocella pacifica]